MKTLVFFLGLIFSFSPIYCEKEVKYEITYLELFIPPASPEFSFEGLDAVPLALKEKLKSGSLDKQYGTNNIYVLEHISNKSFYELKETFMANIYGERLDSSETKTRNASPHYKDFNLSYGYVETNDKSKALKYELGANLKWAINENFSKEIFGYTCYKANSIVIKGKREIEVEAWFTEDIPISNGPGFYHGLPGLILELREGNKKIVVNDITISLVRDTINTIQFPKERPLVKDKKEWQRINKKDM